MSFIWLQLAIVAASIAGFCIAWCVYRHKQGKQKVLVCPLHFDCNAVVYSPHAEFLGMPVEKLGMVYYAVMACAHAWLLAAPPTIADAAGFLLLGASVLAFLFSLYLTLVQIVAIRQLCSLCLASALLSGVILWLSLMAARVDFTMILLQSQPALLMLQAVALALGFGATAMSNIFFFRFMKDQRLSHAEAEVLHLITQVVWFMLGIIVLTGAGVFFAAAEALLATKTFWLSLGTLVVLIASSAIQQYMVWPKLMRISFGLRHLRRPGGIPRLQGAAYLLGLVSLISWYALFSIIQS